MTLVSSVYWKFIHVIHWSLTLVIDFGFKLKLITFCNYVLRKLIEYFRDPWYLN